MQCHRARLPPRKVHILLLLYSQRSSHSPYIPSPPTFQKGRKKVFPFGRPLSLSSSSFQRRPSPLRPAKADGVSEEEGGATSIRRKTRNKATGGGGGGGGGKGGMAGGDGKREARARGRLTASSARNSIVEAVPRKRAAW